MGLIVHKDKTAPDTPELREFLRQIRSSYAGTDYRVVVEVWADEDAAPGEFAVSVNDDGMTIVAYFDTHANLIGDWA